MKTFPMGGVHPSDNKKWSNTKAIEVMDLPDIVNIPLGQHIGAPATAKVAKGDKVLTGQLIAEASSFMSAHWPVNRVRGLAIVDFLCLLQCVSGNKIIPGPPALQAFFCGRKFFCPARAAHALIYMRLRRYFARRAQKFNFLDFFGSLRKIGANFL